jgi:hypothetical protein
MLEDLFKEWFAHLTMKEQATLCTALRGTDSASTPEIKLMTRWIRSVILIDADPSNPFMQKTDFQPVVTVAKSNPFSLDMLTIHFYSHLMHAFQVIAYRHPDDAISERALKAYLDLCNYLHLNPETESQMRERLLDKVVPRSKRIKSSAIYSSSGLTVGSLMNSRSGGQCE